MVVAPNCPQRQLSAGHVLFCFERSLETSLTAWIQQRKRNHLEIRPAHSKFAPMKRPNSIQHDIKRYRDGKHKSKPKTVGTYSPNTKEVKWNLSAQKNEFINKREKKKPITK